MQASALKFPVSSLTVGAHFPHDKLADFMEIVGNDIPLRWLAHQRGHELRPLRSTLEQQNAELRAQIAEQQRQLEAIKAFVRETR